MNKWNLVKLSEVLDYEQPTKYIVETTNYNDKHNIPVLTAGKSFLLGYTNEKTGIFPEKKLPIIIFDDFTTASKLVDFPFKVKSSAMKMLHSKNEDVDIKYVFYAMQNIHFSPEEHKRFWISKYSNFKIPFPPLAEQQKIASFLTRIEALIQKREESIQLLDELIKSTFLDMFGDPVYNPKGWEKRSVSSFATVRIGPFGSLLHAEDYIFGGIPLINPSHIVDGEIQMDQNFTVKNDKFQELSAYQLKSNDIVVARRGEIGRCAIVKINSKLLCGTGSMFIRIIDGCLPTLLQFMIFKTSLRSYLESKAKGVTMKNINSSIIGNMMVIIPPKPLQDKFASIVTKIEASKAKCQSSLEELNNLFNSTAQKAFKGELNLGNIAVIEKEISKEEAQVLDEDKVLELIQSGSFEAKDHVNEKQSYDDIRDMVLKLMDKGKITQKFTDDKKMALEAIN